MPPGEQPKLRVINPAGSSGGNSPDTVPFSTFYGVKMELKRERAQKRQLQSANCELVAENSKLKIAISALFGDRK